MSRKHWMPWAVVCLTAAGCTTGDKIAAFRSRVASAPPAAQASVRQGSAAPTGVVQASAIQGVDRQAETAWRSGPGAAGYTLPADYQRGWRDGYVDYLTYGNSGDPRVANRTRTSSSNEWLAGFRDGMTSAYSSIASEYPTLVSAAEPPIERPSMPAMMEPAPTIVAEAPLPVPPTPRLEKRVESQSMATPSTASQPQAPPSVPQQSVPYTRMADNPRQGMPLPGGLRAEEVDQTAIWATGQQTIANQQPAIVRLPATGEAVPYGTR